MKGKNKINHEENEIDPKTRRTCHKCSKKLYIQNMTKVYYYLPKESYWFCNTCFNSREKNVVIRKGIKKTAIVLG